MQTQSTVELFASMAADFERLRAGEELDFQATHEASVRAIGAIPVLIETFRRFEDSTLTGYLNLLAFAWEDLPFSAWREILRGIDGSTAAIYQFVWFSSQLLRLDVLVVIRSDAQLSSAAKDFVAFEFRGGAPMGGDLESEMLAEIGVDAPAMWRRLASEGAPMKIKPNEMK